VCQFSIFNFQFPIADCRRQRRCALGFSLVEVIAAAAILAIAALGTLGYQYHATKQARVAHAQITATRIGQLLLEDWKSTGGSDQYDPTSLGQGFESISLSSYFNQCESQGLGTTLHNEAYAITIDGLPMQVALKFKDISTDAVARVTLRQLGVVVRFDEPVGKAGSLAAYNPAILLTTYVRLDESGG